LRQAAAGSKRARQLEAKQRVHFPGQLHGFRLLGQKLARFRDLATDVVEGACVGIKVILAAGQQIAALPRLHTAER